MALAQFLGTAVVIVIAGTFLTRYADAIADLTKLGRLVVGSVLLAGATSLPELTVDMSAIWLDLPDLAVGDLLGSSLMNLLILAALDLSSRSKGKMLSREAAAHALSGAVSVALAAIVALGILTGPALAPYSLFGISPMILVLVVAYVFGVRLIYIDQQVASRAAAAVDNADAHQPPAMTLTQALVGFAVCAGVILVVGPYMAEAAGELAKMSGLGETFVGTTLVALSTSLPELVSMIAALRMGAVDLAIGNVFGSNAFNMILLAPLDFAYRESLFAAIASRHAVTCIAAILATQVAIMGQLYRAEARQRFLDPDAWIVIAIVLGALALVYYLP